MHKNEATLDKYLIDGTYVILRKLKGFTLNDVLGLKTSQFNLLLVKLNEENKEREKLRKKNGKHKR